AVASRQPPQDPLMRRSLAAIAIAATAFGGIAASEERMPPEGIDYAWALEVGDAESFGFGSGSSVPGEDGALANPGHVADMTCGQDAYARCDKALYELLEAGTVTVNVFMPIGNHIEVSAFASDETGARGDTLGSETNIAFITDVGPLSPASTFTFEMDEPGFVMFEASMVLQVTGYSVSVALD
ncbi:MAG: hypothetical protein ACI867_001397, partial [Glaciecola sp.]